MRADVIHTKPTNTGTDLGIVMIFIELDVSASLSSQPGQLVSELLTCTGRARLNMDQYSPSSYPLGVLKWVLDPHVSAIVRMITMPMNKPKNMRLQSDDSDKQLEKEVTDVTFKIKLNDEMVNDKVATIKLINN